MEQKQRKPLLVNRKKPYVTYTLIGICVLIFILDYGLRLYVAWKYNINFSYVKAFGIKSNEYIKMGQIWRLLTAVFLHGDITHLGFNMLALYSLGKPVETLYGRKRYIIIFILAGLMGSAASFAFTAANSLGASGAIFGLLGALIYFGTYNRELFKKIFGKQLYILLGINLVLGFVLVYVDNFGHIGGLVGGYLAAGAVGLLTQKLQKRKNVALYNAGLIVVFAGLFLIGLLK